MISTTSEKSVDCPKCGWVPQFEEDSDAGLEGSVFVCEACEAMFATASTQDCQHC